MMQFDFHCEWQEGHKEVRDPAHRATWAHLQMGANGQWFTANAPLDRDDESAEARDFIAVSVFRWRSSSPQTGGPCCMSPRKKKNCCWIPALSSKGTGSIGTRTALPTRH